MQSRIFTGVQNTSTMNRYAAQWSDLLLFLLKLAESNESCLTLSVRYIRHLPSFDACMKCIQTLGEALLAVNTKQLSLENCLREFVEEEEGEEDVKSNSSDTPIKPLARQARISPMRSTAYPSPWYATIGTNPPLRVQSQASWHCIQSTKKVPGFGRHIFLSPERLDTLHAALATGLLLARVSQGAGVARQRGALDPRAMRAVSGKLGFLPLLRAQLVAAAMLDCQQRLSTPSDHHRQRGLHAGHPQKREAQPGGLASRSSCVAGVGQ